MYLVAKLWEWNNESRVFAQPFKLQIEFWGGRVPGPCEDVEVQWTLVDLDVKEKKGFSHMDRCFRLYCSQTSSWHTTTFPSQVAECQLSLKCLDCAEFARTTQSSWMVIFSVSPVFQHLMFFPLFALKVTSSFNLISVWFEPRSASGGRTWRMPPRSLEVVL